MPTKADCIAAAIAAGAAPERAPALVDFVLKEQAAMKAEGRLTNLEGELARKVQDAAEAERGRLLQERRNTAITIVKRKRLEEHMVHLQAGGLSFNDAVLAVLRGDRGRIAGGRESVARRADAHRLIWRSELVRALDEVPGLGEMLRKDAAFDGLVRREMGEPGSTGDPLARQAAAIFSRSLEDIRQTLNDSGANIGRLENYRPQNHDAPNLLKAGVGPWVDRMMRDLDWDRTMPGLPVDRRREVLSEMWTTIVTGQRPAAREPGANPFRKPHNVAKGFEHERTLHFKDAETAANYHAEFGRGTILDAVAGRQERAARDAGLMDVLGPNPETMLESLYSGERVRLRNLTPDEVRQLADKKTDKKLKALEKRVAKGDAEAPREWDRLVEGLREERIKEVGHFQPGDRKGRVGHIFSVLMGETGGAETPTGARVAWGLRAVRNVNILSMMGSATLAAIGDIQTKALWFRHGGENIFESIYRGFKMNLEGLQTAEKKEIGRQLAFYSNWFLSEFNNRLTDGDAVPGWLSRHANLIFKVSGLNAWTEAHKAAAGFYLANRMARNSGKEFSQLNKHYAATLKRAGLDKRWGLLRQLATKEADGQRYVIPESARKLTESQLEPYMPERLRESNRPSDPVRAEGFDAARLKEQDRLRKELELDLIGYMHDDIHSAVIEPDAQSRAATTFGTKAGSFLGETWRNIIQFKSFPIGYTQRILMEQRWLRAADEGSFKDHAAGLVFAATACAVMGYLSITARDLTMGREPRDPTRLGTVYASIWYGGGAGIFSDFFQARLNRAGQTFGETMLGPTFSRGASLADAWIMASHGETTRARDRVVRTGLSSIPYSNLWWARSALDFAMFHHVREWMSPGSLARAEQGLRDDFNQRYLQIGGLDLTPQRHIKRGGGFK